MFPTNSVLAAAIFCMSLAGASSPGWAESGDYLSRRDTVSLSAGNAARANLAIQTPTPWPPYVNDTNIPGSGRQGVKAIENLYKPPRGQNAVAPSPENILQSLTPQ